MGYAGSDGHGGGDGGIGVVVIRLNRDSDFCNARGPFNECIMNETNTLQNRVYNVSSVFEVRQSVLFKAFNGMATLKVTNISSISGMWRGDFQLVAEDPRLKAGTRFRPEERIVVGK